MAQGFCRQAYDLLMEISSCPAENIPPFNDDLFRSVLDEIQLQHDQLTAVFNDTVERHRQQLEERGEDPEETSNAAMWHGSEAEATEVMVYHSAILRNKRLLMAYTKRRLDFLHDLRWTQGTLPDHVKANVTPQELDFFKGYSKLLGQYMRSIELGGVGLDLTADPVPPEDPFVQVRVLQDYGDAAFSSGSIKLRRGQSHWLPRDEAHGLILDGVLECVGSGEFYSMGVVVFANISEMRAYSRQKRRDGKTIGLVPTLGYLHDGHISLIKAAKQRCDIVIATIYVNPTQFSKNEDFGVYPRSREADLAKVEAAACDAVFLPAQSLYHTPNSDTGMVIGTEDSIEYDSHSTWVTVDHVSQGLCAGSRPHFFRGVCTIVAKLFNITEPDAAFFGKKDYQQWRVLERMVRDLDFPIDVIGMPIVREQDGLAMSSRNALLTPENRAAAPCIYESLSKAKDDIASGALSSSTEDIQKQIAASIESRGGKMEYVHVVHQSTMQPVASAVQGNTLIAVAFHFGSVRLIDNIEL